MTGAEVRLHRPYRWVTCRRDEGWTAAEHRHIVARGQLTSLCGCTASTPDTWQPNHAKPVCPRCVDRLAGKPVDGCIPIPKAERAAIGTVTEPIEETS